MPEISFLKIWQSDEATINETIKQLLIHDFKIKTESENPYLRLISMFKYEKCIFLSDFENELMENDNFFNHLTKEFSNNSNHSDILIKALYLSGEDEDFKRIRELQQIAYKKEVESNLKKESLTLFENTYDENPDDICPFNPHDNSSFYGYDPITGKNELLSPHHLFQIKGQCYDIDSIFRYISEGGQIDLDEHYIKKFFDKKGTVNFSNEGLTNSQLEKKTYHVGTKTLILDSNNITSLLNLHIPKDILYLSVNSNPIGNNYFLEDFNNLMVLSMRDCGIKVLDCSHLPESVENLNVSKNDSLTEIHGLSKMKKLRQLNITGTGVKKLDFRRFYSIRETNDKTKLTIICDPDVRFKNEKQEWITIKN